MRPGLLALLAMVSGCTCPRHPAETPPSPAQAAAPAPMAPAAAPTPAPAPPPGAIAAPWRDDFARAELGPDWHPTASVYRLENRAVRAQKAYNHPLWLRRQLPRDVVIELEATSYSPSGDIKVEVFGDGQSYATTRGAYRATGYVLVFGGWHNSISVLARMDEHGSDRKERRDLRVVPGRTYRWKVVRKGNKISWWIDEQPFLEYDDPAPLAGPGHEHFGINNWESDIAISNLRISPAP